MPPTRRVFKSGNSMVLSIPQHIAEQLHIEPGTVLTICITGPGAFTATHEPDHRVGRSPDPRPS